MRRTEGAEECAEGSRHGLPWSHKGAERPLNRAPRGGVMDGGMGWVYTLGDSGLWKIEVSREGRKGNF